MFVAPIARLDDAFRWIAPAIYCIHHIIQSERFPVVVLCEVLIYMEYVSLVIVLDLPRFGHFWPYFYAVSWGELQQPTVRPSPIMEQRNPGAGLREVPLRREAVIQHPKVTAHLDAVRCHGCRRCCGRGSCRCDRGWNRRRRESWRCDGLRRCCGASVFGRTSAGKGECHYCSQCQTQPNGSDH